ncbi:MAG: hypothetical protein JO079_04115 [Frankiaceae bacterium]|nr:hypothetical protein [Frankiaceae bacterium]MBV9368274.1 hypothetical protein [Frankiales bacterium]
MKRRLAIAATLVGVVAGTTGAAVAAELPGASDHNNHNVCVVYSPNQKYNDTWYYCISTPDLPPQ